MRACALGVTSVKQLDAKSESGTDFYIAATKIVFDQSLLLNEIGRASCRERV